MAKALVIGVSGQDGAYLAQLLVEKGYEVYGTSRNTSACELKSLERLGIRRHVTCITSHPSDASSTSEALASIRPDEIYNLSGPSFVTKSFEQPAETVRTITDGLMNLLEAIRHTGHNCRVFNAASSECFGHLPPGTPASEQTLLSPVSPYGIAKSTCHWLIGC